VVAALVTTIAGLPLATSAAYLLPIALVPLAVAWWGWRAGTDADADGLSVRAALGSRRVPWSAVAELGADDRGRVAARLLDGRLLPLPAVRSADLPALVAAGAPPGRSAQ
jgi:hypothetical protein